MCWINGSNSFAMFKRMAQRKKALKKDKLTHDIFLEKFRM
jgi:hypothetical protein